MDLVPLVSIIVPVYKAENYIEDSIKSVLGQTYKNLELIVVDDGSPDESINRAKMILKESQLQYEIIRQENLGQGSARNAGLRVANGEWVLFLDSDDMLSDNGIEHMVSAISSDVDLVFCNYNSIISSNEAIIECESCTPQYFSRNSLQKLFLKRKKVVLAPGTLFRKEFLMKNNLFFENIRWSEDQYFIWQVLYHITGACYLNEPIYQYLRRPGSIMTASEVQTMKMSYKTVCILSKYYENEKYVGQYIVPRWTMGTMNASAKYLPYAEWKILWDEIECSKHYRKLIMFPDIKVRIISIVGCLSKKLYYCILRMR